VLVSEPMKKPRTSAEASHSMGKARTKRTATVALLLTPVLSGGCSAALSSASRPGAVREFSAQAGVRGEALTLHLASPSTPPTASTPLVLYASGDGGWFGAAVTMFRTITGRGLPAVGFSTKAFMHLEHRSTMPLTVARLAEDYQRIIEAACAELSLPHGAPVILTGWSRGASLGVLVATSRDVDTHVIGLVAVGLPADERLDIEGDGDDDAGPTEMAPVADDLHAPTIAMYPLLTRLAPRRSVVIQAAGDRYLPAARARELFGSDSPVRRLVAIDAHNHRFGGGESSFAAALIAAVDWVSSSGEPR
jgi:hypothetical protein